MSDPTVEVRRADVGDHDEVVGVDRRALGWAADGRDRALFDWKHGENPLARRPSSVATVDGRVVGFRSFICWGTPPRRRAARLVRAVDTATDPTVQGRGIFRRLTLESIAALPALGFDRDLQHAERPEPPGLAEDGLVPARETHPRGRAAQPGQPGEDGALAHPCRPLVAPPARWAHRAAEALAELGSVPGTADQSRWHTPRSIEYLRWRYRSSRSTTA